VNSRLQTIYDSLPGGLRSTAATARGLYLRAWRYGPETARIVEEARARERWPSDSWSRFQAEKLRAVLHRAATRVPFYRDQWAARRRGGDRSPFEVLDNWPVLEKRTLREHARAFVADDCRPRRMFQEHTSGTTGTPLQLWRSLRTVRAWYALSEARWRGWYGVSAKDRWAILGGQLVTPAAQQRPPFWVWNAGLNQLYMSAYHLQPEFVPSYVEALRTFRVRYLWGYPSALHALACEVLRSGTEAGPFVVAIANAEPVLPYQRDAIERAFGCPLRETYGMAEQTAAASECEAGRLHLWPEAGFVEVLQNGCPVPRGDVGDLVCTSLLDVDMPLIRYRIGDHGALDPAERCDCGRTLPILRSVEGRADDVVITPDGRRVGRLDPIFKSEMPIREAQIVQEALDHLNVRIVPDSGFAAEHAQQVVDRLRMRVGPVRVTVETLPAIPRGANGKFRAVVSRMTHQELEHASAPRG
jgi:phenylacetate-CoA ligase